MTDLARLRIQLHANGYRPVPVSSPNGLLSKAGKAPFMKEWASICATADESTIREWTKRRPNDGNTGLLCGELIGLDLDIPVLALAEQIGLMADAMLGATPLIRIGKAPKALRCYRAEYPVVKSETAELMLSDGTVVQIEAMGQGQQVVAFGTHPDTLRDYEWPAKSPLDVPLADLSVIGESTLRTFLIAAEAVLRAAGGRTKKEIEAAEKEGNKNAEPSQPPQPEPDQAADGEPTDGKNAFFREVNKRALGNIGPWFKALFPTGEEQTGGGLTNGCWRVSSAALGRNLEEDISVHPTDGGHDFGTRKSCSPIDLALQWGGAPNARAAAFWLCEKLGIAPADCGWTEPKAKKARPASTSRRDESLPIIRVVAGELHLAASEGEAALIAAGLPIYQRGHSLVRPVTQEVHAARGRMTISAALVALTLHSLIDALCTVATWERFDARTEDWVRIDPPKRVADTILSRAGVWTFPKIIGVVTTPTIRQDGSILAAPGYDPATRLYHAADPSVRLTETVRRPSRSDAESALDLLSALLVEFPFVDGRGGVDEAVALSAMITPVVRGAIPNAPMHAFRANTAGTGKSFLADVSSAISAGRDCPVAAAGSDEIETEKRLAGLLLAGFPLISLDNVNGELGGDLLCQAIERPLIRLRPLGRSDIVEVESRATIFGNGNGMRVRGDMTRRTLTCDLDAGVERPELREFRDNPVAMVMADRGAYVSACLVIVRAYLAAGSPEKRPPVASFTEWSDLVRSALIWLGCSDPAQSMEAAREDDPELSELREIIEVWRETLPVNTPLTCKRIVAWSDDKKLAADGRQTDQFMWPNLRDLLHRLAGERNGSINMNRLGAKIRKSASMMAGLLADFELVANGSKAPLPSIDWCTWEARLARFGRSFPTTPCGVAEIDLCV